MSVKADREFLSKTINLSQLVTDGTKVYVRPIGEDQGDKGDKGGSARVATYTIYINSASKEELETLWGVGQARAEAIITGRPYSDIEDLIAKKVLPKSVVEKNRGRLML